MAGFYAQEGRLLEALAVVDSLMAHVPESRTLSYARAGLRSSIEISGFNHKRSAQLDWPTSEPEPGWELFDPRIANAAGRLPTSLQARLLPLAQRFSNDDGFRNITLTIAAGLLLMTFFVLLRQRGDVCQILAGSATTGSAAWTT